ITLDLIYTVSPSSTPSPSAPVTSTTSLAWRSAASHSSDASGSSACFAISLASTTSVLGGTVPTTDRKSAVYGTKQIDYGYGVIEYHEIVEETGGVFLVFHFNSLQVVVQAGGYLNFENIVPVVEKVCVELEVPVGVKEVGFGIDGTVAKKFHDAGVSYIDVAGAGGTSWSQVEKLRSKDPLRQRAAEAFNSWGNPTKDCLVSVRKNLPETTLVASGGMKTGLDAAKAITIGANVVGFARTLLQAATESVDDVLQVMEQIEFELKMTMFGVGVDSIEGLRN